MVYRVTLDESCMREISMSDAFHKLKQWQNEGKVEIFDAQAEKNSGKVQRRPQPWEKRSSASNLFSQIAGVLFVHRDPKKLSMSEINDVAHLIQHQISGREIFITTNKADFLDDGKQARLQSMFKIIALTPDEAVAAIASGLSK